MSTDSLHKVLCERFAQAEIRYMRAEQNVQDLRRICETTKESLRLDQLRLQDVYKFNEELTPEKPEYIEQFQSKVDEWTMQVDCAVGALQYAERTASTAKNDFIYLKARLADVEGRSEHIGKQEPSKSSWWPTWWSKPKTQPPSTIHEELIAAWQQQVTRAFKDYSKICVFPAPPQLIPCKTPDACAVDNNTLQVCQCQIAHAFKDVQNLKKARLSWHPDRFAICAEEWREQFACNAKEMFIVVDAMYRESLEGGS